MFMQEYQNDRIVTIWETLGCDNDSVDGDDTLVVIDDDDDDDDDGGCV